MLQSFQHLSDVDFENLPDNIFNALGTNESTIKADFLIDGFNLEWYESGLAGVLTVVVHDQKVIHQGGLLFGTPSAALLAALSKLQQGINASYAVQDDAGQEECFRRAHQFITPLGQTTDQS